MQCDQALSVVVIVVECNIPMSIDFTYSMEDCDVTCRWNKLSVKDVTWWQNNLMLTLCFLSISYSSSSKFSTAHTARSRRGHHCPSKPHAADGSWSDWSAVCANQHPRAPASTHRCAGHPACTDRSARPAHVCVTHHTGNTAGSYSHSAAAATTAVRGQTW